MLPCVGSSSGSAICDHPGCHLHHRILFHRPTEPLRNRRGEQARYIHACPRPCVRGRAPRRQRRAITRRAMDDGAVFGSWRFGFIAGCSLIERSGLGSDVRSISAPLGRSPHGDGVLTSPDASRIPGDRVHGANGPCLSVPGKARSPSTESQSSTSATWPEATASSCSGCRARHAWDGNMYALLPHKAP